MTSDQMEGRIAELEHALEDLLECFEPIGTALCIEVKSNEPPYTGIFMDITEEVNELVEAAHSALYGGAAYAQEG